MRAYLQILQLAFTISTGVVPNLSLAEITTAKASEDVAFFEKKVRPILVTSCYTCHSADTKAAGGLRVDDRNGLLMGGDTGPAVVPGDPKQSLLLQRVTHDDPKRKMPKEGDLLTDSQIQDLTKWIEDGAAWPRERVPASIGRVRAEHEELKAKHWAWQPLTNPSVPVVGDTEWPAGDIDRFILAKIESENLHPVADADPATLIRRVTYDLTGLPPSPAEIDSFVKDTAPDAFSRVVDRLLKSPQFGERWGRHWLDVARYGESTGPSRNIPYPHAWRYRDYVIEAFNKDVPFDRFVREQIAGDLLPAETPAERDRLATATGFLALGVKDVNQRFKVRFIMDNVDEQIDTVSRAVLGLTVSCARCHDHKFDPISVTDYYAFAGIFTSTEDCAGVRNKMGGGGLDYYNPSMLVRLSTEVPEPPADKIESLTKQVAAAKEAFEAIRGTAEGRALGADGRPKQRVLRLKYDRLKADLDSIADPATQGFAIHGVRDSKTVRDTEIRIRGEAERLGPVVPRGFLSTFHVPGAPEINTTESGRMELAQWLTNSRNPLTPRVFVNRVWKNLFGQGLVTTVDNFGVKGDVPSHPELLDYLASQVIRDGWSTKRLIKKIVLSRAYRLGTDAPSLHKEIDPSNRLIWRHSPRRLDAEEIRDAMLVTTGRLQLQAPEGSPTRELRMIELRDNGPDARKIQERADRANVRSIYLPLLRGVTPKTLEAFDPVQQTLVTGQRDATTVPTQALFMLNSGFVRQQALTLAERVLSENDKFDADWIKKVYLLVLSRTPTDQEIVRSVQFLSEYEASYRVSVPSGPVLKAEQERETAAENQAEVDPDANPDDIDRTNEIAKEVTVEPKSPKAAAWMSLVQALYASAEFRFAR